MERQVTIPREETSFNQVGRELSKARRLWDASVLWGRDHRDVLVGVPLILGASAVGFSFGLLPGLCALTTSAFLASIYSDKMRPIQARLFGDRCFDLGTGGLIVLGACLLAAADSNLPMTKYTAERVTEWRATNRILAGETRALESNAYQEWLFGYGENGTASTLLNRQCISADRTVVVIRNDSNGGPLTPDHYTAYVKEARPGGVDEWVEKKMTPALAVCRR